MLIFYTIKILCRLCPSPFFNKRWCTIILLYRHDQTSPTRKSAVSFTVYTIHWHVASDTLNSVWGPRRTVAVSCMDYKLLLL